jgi:protein-S-isoprenylcysteine O-methyltransferase Ste14
MSERQTAQKVDPRGLRFAAGVTTVVLALTLVLDSAWPLAVQAVVFAISVAFGVQASPYGLLFKRLIRPRLDPPSELEDAAPPRFAQLVGLVFAVAGLVGYLTGVTVLGVVATGFALVAAFVNAAVGLCLGCEAYLLIHRIRTPNRLTNTATN